MDASTPKPDQDHDTVRREHSDAAPEATTAAATEAADQPAAAPADSPAADPPAAPITRHERNWKDMVYSLATIMIPVVLLLAFYRYFLDGEKPVEIDPGNALAEARAARAFEVLEPRGLSDEWIPTTANFRTVDGGKTLRIGYVSPSDGSVLLVESTVPTETLLPAELTSSARPGTLVAIDGREWQSYSARDNESALVLLDPARTVVIVGTGEPDDLRELADSLG